MSGNVSLTIGRSPRRRLRDTRRPRLPSVEWTRMSFPRRPWRAEKCPGCISSERSWMLPDTSAATTFNGHGRPAFVQGRQSNFLLLDRHRRFSLRIEEGHGNDLGRDFLANGLNRNLHLHAITQFGMIGINAG